MDRLRIAGIAVALSAVAIVPATATGATTLGPSPLPAADASLTAGSCCIATYVITAYPGATLAAPTAGVITRWRVREPGTQPALMSPRVLRAAGGASFTGVTTGAQVPVGTSSTVKTYATRLRIAAGDLFGVDASTGPSTGVTGAAFRTGLPAITNGATADLSSCFGDTALGVNADMEPDADGDGFGDEPQDLGPAAAPQAARTELGRIAPATAVTLTNRDSQPTTIASARVAGSSPDDFLVTSDDCTGTMLDPVPRATSGSGSRPPRPAPAPPR